jgi:acyl-phosphate glycerol 3-phosphate acyltransferase
MRWEILAIALASGYIVGSIPFSILINRLFAGGKKMEDIQVPVPGTTEVYRVSSKGAAAASMTLGARAGCAIGILDMMKVALPTLVFRLIFQDPSYFLTAAIAGMIGHDWPLFNRFRGGRGVSSVYGALFVIDWIGAFSVAAAGLFVGFLVLRDFVFAYMAGIFFIIPWMWFRFHDWRYLVFAILVNIIFMTAMIPDLKQYLRLKKIGKIDMAMVNSTTPMGRGMQKIMDKLGLAKKGEGRPK